MSDKTILALDAGIARLGAVVIRTGTSKVLRYTCLRTEPRNKESLAEGNARRCKELAVQLKRLCDDYCVAFICVELPTGGAKSARAMSAMSMATAVIATFAATRGLPLFPVTPNEIKRLVKSKGAVEKEAVSKFVERAYGMKFPSKKDVREHLTDAAASYLVARKKFRSEISETT